MHDPIRFRVRPVYRGSQLLIEVMDDHRVEDFPKVAAILRDALGATQMPHPDKLDDPHIALRHDRYFSFWVYPGGTYEIDDDVWALFILAHERSETAIEDVARALIATGRFVREFVDYAQFR